MSRWQHFKAFAGGLLTVLGGLIAVLGLILPLAGVENIHLVYLTIIIGVLLAYWGTYQNNVALGKRLTPALRFSTGPDVVGASDYSEEISPYYSIQSGIRVLHPKQEEMRWLRVVVETKQEAPVKDCVAELTGIFKEGQSVFPPNKVRLTWQPGSRNQAPRTVHPGTPEYLDIMAITKSGVIKIATPGLDWGFEQTDKIFEREGDYVLTVAVKTDGATNHIMLRFVWRKDWEKSELHISGAPD